MSIPINIEGLINDRVVESTRIDYKKGFDPNAVVHSICAFANDIDNTGGGYIIIGIEEEDGMPKLPICGIDKNKIDNILKDLIGYCNQIEPRYLPIVEPVNYMDKYLIVIWVPAGHGRPYKVSKDIFTNSPKRYYIRKMSSSIIAKPEEEKMLFYVSEDIPFDDRPNLLAGVDDIDISLLRKFLYDANSSLYDLSLKMNTFEIASNMQLLSGPTEAIHPRNVALLMFNENPEEFFRCARIEVVDIPNPTGEGMVEKVFTGPIQRQLKDALQYIKNYILKEKITKLDNQAEAKRVFNYPYRTIEEILSNAVYHKSYSIAEPITVRITPSEMEITSFPGLDNSITDENIKNLKIRSRIYRNRRIGDFFKELKLTEGRNTGIPNAILALKNNGSNDMRFEMDNERRYVSVIIPIHNDFISTATVVSIKKTRMDRNEIKEKIIDILANNGSKSISEISILLGNKRVSKTLNLVVAEMIAEGIVIYEKSGRTSFVRLK